MQAKLWMVKDNLIVRRCRHVLEAVDDRLYAICGKNIDNGSSPKTAEMFNPVTNQWSYIVADLPELDAPSSFVYNHLIVMVGGTGPNKHRVQAYNVDSKKIVWSTRIQCDAWRNICALMTLPKLL